MPTEITRLQASDFEETLDVLNLSFGMQHPNDFETLLPALYQHGEEQMSWNWALRENGRIRAIVGLFPLACRLGDTTLRIAGIGGVACHPRARGTGHMQKLMKHCVETMPAEGYHLSWLGGQRQRYAYFGYEKCGVYYQFSLSKTNLHHAFDDRDTGISFRPLTREDQTHLASVIALHDAQSTRAVRASDRFYDLLLSWRHRPHIALSPDSRMIGYLVANQTGDLVTELFAVDEGQPDLDIATAWVQSQSGHSVNFELPPWHRLLPQLGQLCEGVDIYSSGNWQIFAWEETLDALLKTRAAQGPLIDGAVVVGIEEYGNVLLEVESGAARCVRTETEPALQMDAHTAMRLLCGPLPPSTVLELPPQAALLEQWCPLPLYWGRQDGV